MYICLLTFTYEQTGGVMVRLTLYRSPLLFYAKRMRFRGLFVIQLLFLTGANHVFVMVHSCLKRQRRK